MTLLTTVPFVRTPVRGRPTDEHVIGRMVDDLVREFGLPRGACVTHNTQRGDRLVMVSITIWGSGIPRSGSPIHLPGVRLAGINPQDEPRLIVGAADRVVCLRDYIPRWYDAARRGDVMV